jgi:hypothetical protein
VKSLALPKLTPAQKAVASALGAALLIGGVVYSVRRLGIGWRDVNALPLLINLLLVQPAIVALAAITLRLSGRAVGADIRLAPATRAVGYATFAEILPLPGGALIRGAALMRAGADLGGAASIVTATALLSLALIVFIASAALWLLGSPHVVPVLLAGLAGTLLFAWRILRRAGLPLTLGITAIRLATISAGAVSVLLALGALSAPASLGEALVISVSGTLGSVVTIVPAGLGISESIAAALASMTSIAPAAAFLALALHRTLALVASLAAAFWPDPRA